jgi:Flp pilus assembly pilin Flp
MGIHGGRAVGRRVPRPYGADDGATAVEYALIAVFVAAVIAGIVSTVGLQLLALFTSASNGFP